MSSSLSECCCCWLAVGGEAWAVEDDEVPAAAAAVEGEEGEEKSRWEVTRWASGTSSMRRKSRAEVERKEALGSEALKGCIGGERDIAPF